MALGNAFNAIATEKVSFVDSLRKANYIFEDPPM